MRFRFQIPGGLAWNGRGPPSELLKIKICYFFGMKVEGFGMAGMPIMTDRAARYLELTSPEHEAATLEEMFQRMTCRVPGIEGKEGRPEGLPAICVSWDIPYGRMLTWLMADAARYSVYKRALEVAAHGLMAEVIDIADNDSPYVQRDKLRAGMRLKFAEYHAPDMYRQRQTIDMNVTHAAWGERLRRARERVIEHEEPEGPEEDAGI